MAQFRKLNANNTDDDTEIIRDKMTALTHICWLCDEGLCRISAVYLCAVSDC